MFSASYYLRRFVRRNTFFIAFYRMSRRHRKVFVSRDSDILVEGFPRSGNTYSVWALKLSNADIKVSSHMHAAAHVFLAIRYGIPVLILLRHPEDAARSLLIRRPNLSPKRVLNDYIDFYQSIESYASQIVIGKFETVSEDFGSIVGEINRRFRVAFQWPATEGDRERVLDAIDSANRLGHGGQVNPLFVPRPHHERELMKKDISFDDCEVEMNEASALYRRLSVNAV